MAFNAIVETRVQGLWKDCEHPVRGVCRDRAFFTPLFPKIHIEGLTSRRLFH